MLTRLRGLLIPVVAAFADHRRSRLRHVDDDSPVDVVQDTTEDVPETVVDDGVVQDDQPTEPEESDDEVTTIDDRTTEPSTTWPTMPLPRG